LQSDEDPDEVEVACGKARKTSIEESSGIWEFQIFKFLSVSIFLKDILTLINWSFQFLTCTKLGSIKKNKLSLAVWLGASETGFEIG
jgi:hypothetical protein